MRIFVVNIAFTTTEEELRELFESYGIVDRAQIMTDRDTGRSRGFGFVEMPDATEAQAAIDGLNPTVTLLEHTLLTQGFMEGQKAAFPCCLQPQNRNSTWTNLAEALK
jgi:RNA recognition motif-containing protein